MKIIISKQMSQDESIQCELQAKDADEMAERLAAAYPILDARLEEQGKRVVIAHGYVQQLPVESRAAVNAVFGILFGRPGATKEMDLAIEMLDNAEKERQVVRQGELKRVEAPLVSVEVGDATVGA